MWDSCEVIFHHEKRQGINANVQQERNTVEEQEFEQAHARPVVLFPRPAFIKTIGHKKAANKRQCFSRDFIIETEQAFRENRKQGVVNCEVNEHGEHPDNREFDQLLL